MTAAPSQSREPTFGDDLRVAESLLGERLREAGDWRPPCTELAILFTQSRQCRQKTDAILKGLPPGSDPEREFIDIGVLAMDMRMCLDGMMGFLRRAVEILFVQAAQQANGGVPPSPWRSEHLPPEPVGVTALRSFLRKLDPRRKFRGTALAMAEFNSLNMALEEIREEAESDPAPLDSRLAGRLYRLLAITERMRIVVAHLSMTWQRYVRSG